MGLNFMMDPYTLPGNQGIGPEGTQPEGPRLTPRRQIPQQPWFGAQPAPGMSAPAMQFMQSLMSQPGGLMGLDPAMYATPLGGPGTMGRTPGIGRVPDLYTAPQSPLGGQGGAGQAETIEQIFRRGSER